MYNYSKPGLCTVLHGLCTGLLKKNMTVKMTYNSHNMTTPSLNYVYCLTYTRLLPYIYSFNG